MIYLAAFFLITMSISLITFYWGLLQDSLEAGHFILSNHPADTVTWMIPLFACATGWLLYWRYEVKKYGGIPKLLKTVSVSLGILSFLVGLALISIHQPYSGLSVIAGSLTLMLMAVRRSSQRLCFIVAGGSLLIIVPFTFFIILGFPLT
ncbi:hypothetical protein [Halopseudomonas pertucinogena]|uniref:hypothetical protein n=1 Tax=Halopseudomonas pertucinogena TaxID=86175 RepID=UPI001666DBBE|nr:hypothetical protein [Halopseudomonas pertucinogena]